MHIPGKGNGWFPKGGGKGGFGKAKGGAKGGGYGKAKGGKGGDELEELFKQEAIGFSMFKNNVMYLFLTLFLAFWLIPTFTEDDKIRYAVSVAAPAAFVAYLASYY